MVRRSALRSIVLGSLVTLGACTAISPADPVSGGRCDADALATFVGQPRSMLLATTFTTPVRIIDPRDVVTQDFSPDRANFVVGRDGRIERVYCG